jgi:hypothetical protein
VTAPYQTFGDLLWRCDNCEAPYVDEEEARKCCSITDDQLAFSEEESEEDPGK